jgi:hypothetical protein
MSFATAEKLLFQEVIDNFPAYNMKFVFPNSVADELAARESSPYVAVRLMPGSDRPASLGGTGNRVYRTQATLVFSVHILQNQGTRVAHSYIDNILAIFQGRNIGNIIVREANSEYVGSLGGWEVYMVQFPVYFNREGV